MSTTSFESVGQPSQGPQPQQQQQQQQQSQGIQTRYQPQNLRQGENYNSHQQVIPPNNGYQQTYSRQPRYNQPQSQQQQLTLAPQPPLQHNPRDINIALCNSGGDLERQFEDAEPVFDDGNFKYRQYTKPTYSSNATHATCCNSTRIFGCGMCVVVTMITVIFTLVFAFILLTQNPLTKQTTDTTTTTRAFLMDMVGMAKSDSPVSTPLLPPQLYPPRNPHETVIPLRIIQRQGKSIRIPIRNMCPTQSNDIPRVISINTVVLQPDNAQTTDAACVLPDIINMGIPRLVCAFDTRVTNSMSWHVYTDIPRTSCTNAECACATAANAWPVISINTQGTVKTAAAYALAEESNTETTIVLFELATISTVAIPTDTSPASGGGGDDDQLSYPPLCYLIIDNNK